MKKVYQRKQVIETHTNCNDSIKLISQRKKKCVQYLLI